MRPASFWQRILGSIVDGIVLQVPWGLIVWVAWDGDFRQGGLAPFALAGVYAVTSIGLVGQTVGKRVVGTKVVADAAGQTPTAAGWLAAVVRWAVLSLPALVPVLGLVVVAVALVGMVTDDLGRGIHDRLAATRVIDVRPPERLRLTDRYRSNVRGSAVGQRPRNKRRRGSPS